VPQACTGGAAELCARLRPEPDGPLGCEAEAGEHGRGGQSCAQGGRCVIEPVLANEDFIADVASARGDSTNVQLWWLGQSGFLLHWMEDFVAIDPYLSDSLTNKYASTDKPHVRMSRRVIDPARLNFVFLILSTHGHTDHLDHETIRPMLRDNPGT